MKKRILAVLLVVALVVVAGVVAVSATTPAANGCPVHENCTAEWVEFDGTALANGVHYVVSADQSYTGTDSLVTMEAGAEAVLKVNEGVKLTVAGADATAECRLATLGAGSTLTICGTGEISGAGNDGGVINMASGAASTLNLYEATLTHGRTATATTPKAGTVVSMKGASGNKAVFNMYSGTLNGGTHYGSNKNHGVVAMGTHTEFNMHDGTINAGNGSGNTGGVYINSSSATFNMHDGLLDGTGDKINRGIVYSTGGIFNMYGGTIQGATSSVQRGGAVCVSNSGVFNLYDGEVIGTSGVGNAVALINAGSKFHMEGGTVTDAGDGLDTICGNGSIVEITGGTLHGIIAAESTTANNITVSGNAVIDNINLSQVAGSTITIGEKGLADGAKIGVTVAADTAFTAANEKAADYAKYFYAVGIRAVVVASEGTLSLQANNACPHCPEGTTPTWSVWDGISHITESGHYYIAASVAKNCSQLEIGVTESETPYVTQDIVVDLNGNTIENSNSRYSVRAGDKLFLMDSVGGGELIGCQSASGGAINLSADAEFTLHSGTVTDGYTSTRASNTYGGVIHFAGKGTAIIKGGTVNGGNAGYGAAIAVQNGGSLTIEGGTIIGGSATYGGAIYVGGSSTAGNCSLIISGGTIRDGSATQGGNIHVAARSDVTISGNANITGGKASSYGGNIRIAEASTANVTIKGGTIELGECTYDSVSSNSFGGGNIFNQGNLTIQDTAVIRDGSSKASGGNIHNRATLTIKGGTITNENGTTAGVGHNIFTYNTAAVNTISGGMITDGDIVCRGTAWKSFTLSGAPTIELLDMSLVDGLQITLGEGGVTSGSITVNAAAGTPFSVANATLAESSKAYFFGADGLVCGVVDGCLVLKVNENCPICGEDVEWIEWNGGNVDPADGSHYRLSANHEGTSRTLIGANSFTADTYAVKTVCIDLNGNNITKTASNTTARALYLRAGITVNLMNTSKTESVISSNIAAEGAALYTEETSLDVDVKGSTVNLYDNVTLKSSADAATTVNTTPVSMGKSCTLNMYGGTIEGHLTTRVASALRVAGNFNMYGGTITGVDNCAVYLNATAVATISGGSITNGTVYPVNGASVTLSGAPVIEELDLTAANPVVLNELTSGADITVIAAAGKAFTAASDYAQAALDNAYIKNGVADAELKCVDGCLVLAIPTLSYVCEHCGDEAGVQIWQPLTNDSYTATGSGATLPGDHYYLPADLSNANRVNLSEGKICLDLHGKTLTNTSLMPFWVKGTGDLGVMDTVGGGELQGSAGKGYGGGVIRMTGGVATVYGGTLRYVGTRGTDDGGVVFVNAATFNMNGGHMVDGNTVGNGGVIYASGEAVVNINGGTMELGTATEGCNGIYLENNHSTLNVDAAATEVLELLDGNVTGNAYSPMNMPYGIGLATVNADVLCTWYADTAEAMAAYDETVNYLKVLGNTGDLDLNGGAYFVDLAGNSIAIENGTVYGMDSANDEFDATACGIATVEAPETYCVAPNGYVYIAVKEAEGEFTFHCLNMQFRRLSLRPGAAGIYYSSSWHGDAVLTGTMADNGMDYETDTMITGYGMALKKNSAATGESFISGDKFAYTYFDNEGGIASNFLANKNGKEINSCLLSNIINVENGATINDENAQVLIYATPYVAFTNYNGETEYVMGPEYGNNLYGIVKYVVDTIAAMEDADARAKNIEKISTLETFADDCGVTFEGLADLIHPTEPAPETPAE